MGYLQNAHVYHFSLKTLTNLAHKAGFELVYGNERINSIFRISNQNYKNDYKETITFLRNLERKNPFNIFRMRNSIFSSVESFTKKTGTSEIARIIYHILD